MSHVKLVHWAAQMPSSDKLCNSFRAAGTKGCLDFSLSLLAACDSVSQLAMQNVARVQRTAISQGKYRSLAAKLSWLDA